MRKNTKRMVFVFICVAILLSGLGIGVQVVEQIQKKEEDYAMQEQDDDFELLTQNDYLERYGRPEKLVVVNLSDPENRIDFDYLNHLQCYVAKPASTSMEMLSGISDYLWGSEDYTIKKTNSPNLSQTLAERLDDSYVSENVDLGEKVVSCADLFLNFTGNHQFEESDDEELLTRKLCEKNHIGLWDDGQNLTAIKDTSLHPPYERTFELQTYLDNIRVNSILYGYSNYEDGDGVIYTTDLPTQFSYVNHNLNWCTSLFSYDITDHYQIPKQYRSLEDLKDSIISGHVSKTEVLTVQPLEYLYAQGVTENGEILYTPCLVFKGEEATYLSDSDQWVSTDDWHVLMNLSNGESFSFGTSNQVE